MYGAPIMTTATPGAFTVTFNPDGIVSGKTDCNGFGGIYGTENDGIIHMGPLMSTLMYCENSQEHVFLGAFGIADHYTFDATGNLTITFGDGMGSMVFAKQETPHSII